MVRHCAKYTCTRCILQVHYKAFQVVLQWLYTLRIEVSLDDVDSVFLLSKQCQLPDLEQQLEDKIRHATSFR